MKILVVDDFAAMRTIVRNFLAGLGFKHVEEADDGTTALPKLNAGDFDFLITGWNMPGMEGIDLIKAVRSDSRLADMPILMVTAEARRAQIVEAAEAGVSGYVIKPFNEKTLKATIERIFAKQRSPA